MPVCPAGAFRRQEATVRHRPRPPPPATPRVSLGITSAGLEACQGLTIPRPAVWSPRTLLLGCSLQKSGCSNGGGFETQPWWDRRGYRSRTWVIPSIYSSNPQIPPKAPPPPSSRKAPALPMQKYLCLSFIFIHAIHQAPAGLRRRIHVHIQRHIRIQSADGASDPTKIQIEDAATGDSYWC